jgi:ribosomal protein L11 methyltransferase
MDHFWLVTLFQLQTSPEERSLIEIKATQYHALGIEEFSLDESEVDAILGQRSYSGGDLPQQVLDEVEQVVLNRPTTCRVFFENEDNARAFMAWLKTRLLCEIQLERCQSEDWNAEWKKHYAPIQIGHELEIIPAWQTDYVSTARRQIFIYPGMGFGTGSHETTFLCLQMLVDHILNSEVERVLDFGSGSGILGLSALLFFPTAKVDFYDIDPEANKNCYHNAELNHLANHSFRLLLPDWRDKLLPSYDLVFANILESILLQERDFLTATVAPQGHLVLSGLLLPQLDNIIAAYQTKGMLLISRLEKGDWGALLFKRMPA